MEHPAERTRGARRAPLADSLADLLAEAMAGDARAQASLAAALPAEEDGALTDAVALAAADGSAVALELLLGVVDESPRTRAPIRRLLVDADAIDDVVQDVLITVAERIATFRGEARFTTWLHQVARFKTIDHLRRQRDEQSLDAEPFEPTDAERVSSMIASRTTIRDALAELPEQYRRAVTWRDLEHLPYDEIAARAHIPVNTAKTHVARGRALLARRLGGEPS
ncbi:MAG: RNA polymerase sigma factor [Desertimonas sp.]